MKIRRDIITLLIAILLSGCVHPAPTRSPLTPSPTVTKTVTPGPSPLVAEIKTPTPIPPDGDGLFNPSMEAPYICEQNAQCVPQGWHGWTLATWPCRPYTEGCDLPCSSTCIKPNGNCNPDSGCTWAGAEIGEITLQYPYRVHSGMSAVKVFARARMWEGGIYQQFYHVPLHSRLHFSIWAQSWQCAIYLNCRWGEISDFPANMNIRVGIDPLGGDDPYMTTVVWSMPGESFDHYSQFDVWATAENQVVTVFAMGAPRWGWPRNDGNDLYLDDARLEVFPPVVMTNTVYLPLVVGP